MASDPRINSLLDQANQLFLKKKFKEAISFYDEILKSQPNHLSVLNNKGYALSKTGNYSDAILCYEKALENYPNDISVLINKISALRKLGNYQDALEYCDKILEKNPNYNVVLYHKERILYSQKMYEESISCCDKILNDYPENADVLFDKSCSMAMLGKNNALDVLEKSIQFGKQFKIKAKNNKSFTNFQNNPRFQKLVG